MSAVISDCGGYRYRLKRIWDEGHLLPICMLNPSTADASKDDPTIRRCIAFAKREGYAGIEVVNLYALRSTSPAAIGAHPYPVGPENRQHLHELATEAAFWGVPILCAWGACGFDSSHALQAFRDAGARMVCLGRTKDGSPRHPLYVRADQPLEDFQ